MILYTNGCSWTWGGALDNYFKFNNQINHSLRLKLLWPHHLGKILNVSRVDNLSLRCGNNDRLCRTTLNYLLSLSEEERKECIPIIQFSESSRFEFYLPDNYTLPYENIDENWMTCKIDVITSSSQKGFKDSHNYQSYINLINDVIKLHTDIQGVYRSLQQIQSLAFMFQQFNIKKYYFWFHSNIQEGWPEHFRTYLYNTFPILNCDIVREQDTIIYERISEKDCHPSLEGHKQLAKCLYDRMIIKGFLDK